jgi:hypothetical protein
VRAGNASALDTHWRDAATTSRPRVTAERGARRSHRLPVSIGPVIIDVWMQHPTLQFLQFLAHDTFAPLLRWTGAKVPQ